MLCLEYTRISRALMRSNLSVVKLISTNEMRQFKRRPDWTAGEPVPRSSGTSRSVFGESGDDLRGDFAATGRVIYRQENGGPIPLAEGSTGTRAGEDEIQVLLALDEIAKEVGQPWAED